MNIFAWVFLFGGLFGILATRLGWYDEGGVMRRLDWFDIYGGIERSWIGGGVRRANYTICGALIVVGLIIIVRAA